ncbi:MAG: lysostaphin resistance A-like protein [Pyrinomonadaceae bacterium]
MNISSVLFDQYDRLRSGWRFGIFLLGIVFAGSLAFAVVVGILAAVSVTAAPGNPVFLAVNGLASLSVALFVGWICGRFLEHLPFRALGASLTNRWLKHLTAGILVGVLTFALAALIGIVGGGLSFRPNAEADHFAILSTLVYSLAIFAAAAAFEEALFRGYILQTFVRSDLAFFAVALTSTLFATVHNANPNANVLSWLNTFLAGIWFGVAYLKTRDLWFPFGLHLAWNWAQGSIFGVEVSGLTEIVKAPILRETDLGPAWLTGGDYGIEGGVVCTIALAASTILIWKLPRLRPTDDMLALTSPPERRPQPGTRASAN